MPKRPVALLFALLLLLSCNTISGIATRPTPTLSIDRAEAGYAVYAAAIQQMFTVDKLDSLVIHDQTSTDPTGNDPEQLKHLRASLPEVSQALLDDFQAQNAEPAQLEDHFNLKVSVVLISQDETSRLFGQGGGGWDEFYKQYPNSQGLMTLSRVGLDPKGDRALVYIGNQSHWLAGAGYAVVLGLTDGQWSILNQVMLWIS